MNTSWESAPWADAVFAMDETWWRRYLKKVSDEFKGRRISTNKISGVERISCYNPGNSGAAAIALAEYWGAKQILLVGYDCKYGPNGERHHHGNHPPGMGNAGSLHKWPDHFKMTERRMRGKAQIINCSRDTALHIWPRMELEDALNAAANPE